ncbi:MAG: hypothetical protein ACLT8E_08370, partial [Akkermansia sp.]
AMGDAHLQQRLEQFIFRQYGRAVLAHYIKALSALELSRHFYLRFRRRSRSVTEPILYWTVLAETTIHMTLEGVKDMHPFISLPACAGATFQLDMLKDCYLLYLRDREYPCWPRASRRRRIIRNKWNAPELEASYFPRLCRNSTDRHYANMMHILLGETTALPDCPSSKSGSTEKPCWSLKSDIRTLPRRRSVFIPSMTRNNFRAASVESDLASSARGRKGRRNPTESACNPRRRKTCTVPGWLPGRLS